MEDSMKQHSRNLRWGLTIGVGILALVGVCLITGCSNDSSDGGTPSVTAPSAPSDPNGVGVRPDVRRYIETTHPNSAKTRAALFQSAKATEAAVADASDKQLSIQHAEESNRASTCLWYTFDSVDATVDSVDTYRKIRNDMQEVVLNTDARNRAYLAYNEQLGGQFFMGIPYNQRVSACDINPSTLPN